MNYANGKIYIILNHINDMVYVGSTCQSLSKRFSWHKRDMKNRKFELYEAMIENGIENFYIELLELFPCSCRDELHKREGQYIRKFDSYKNGYNGRIEGRTCKEYYQDNIEQIKEQKKEYREKNRDDILKKKRNYYQNNKIGIKEKKSQKFVCDCGGKYTKSHKARHLKTKKHKKYIDEQQKLKYIVNI